jgi:hypothetical protein
MHRKWIVSSLLLMAATALAVPPENTPPTEKAAARKTALKEPTAKKQMWKKTREGKTAPKRVYAKSGPGIYEKAAPPTPANAIDDIVFAKLKSLKIEPVLCSDAVFVRRAFLDTIGTLPSAEAAGTFIADKNPHKRAALVNRLMAREEFATYWAMKWSDVLRIKAEFPINLWPNAAQAYHRWIKASISENKPYDQFAREMLTASGSNFRVPPVNFYRALQNKTPEGIATTVALTFMGVRAESWSEAEFAGMVSLFSQVGYKPTNEWKEENVFWDPLRLSKAAGAPGNAKVTTVVTEPSNAIPGVVSAPAPKSVTLPDGTTLKVPADRDPREVFADWLITPENPWFTRSIANRIWAWLLGRGIVHQPDDIRKDNPPSIPELLAFLEKELQTHHYDLKHLYRLILTSNTYQLSSIQHVKSPEAEANFATYPLRRMEAEVLIDALNKITGTTDLYTSPIPEPFTYIPKDQPAISIADGSITSRFLALFGRSARATGMSDERNNDPIAAQRMYMLNSGHIQRKIESGPRLKRLFKAKQPMLDKAETLYLTILSRYPTAEEIEVMRNYGNVGAYKKWTDWIDITWSLLNSPEFLYRH